MWLIGIKSGIITVLALIAYGLLVDLLHLQASIWGHLELIVLALGIYSSHYYYKQAHQGYMAYGQGLQIGLMVVAFTGVVSGISSYLVSKFLDPGFINRLVSSLQVGLEQSGLPEDNQRLLALMESILTPQTLSIFTCLSTCLVGFILNLLIAGFTKRIQPKTFTSTP
jgi:Protein of unknown function (DUF4199)